MLTNHEIADQFYELSKLLSKYGEDFNDRFRVGAYEKAADIIKTCNLNLHKMSAKELATIKGIGKNTAEKIFVICQTNKPLPKLIELRSHEVANPKDELKTLNPILTVLSINSSKVQFIKIKDEYVFICKQDDHLIGNTIGMINGVSKEISNGVNTIKKIHRSCVNIQFWIYFN